MADWGMIVAPASIQVSFKVAPVPVMLHSLQLASYAEMYSGLGDWISHTARTLSPQQRQDLAILCLNLSDSFAFVYQDATFPEFINHLSKMSSQTLLESSTLWMKDKPHFTSLENLLNDPDAYFQFMGEVHAEKNDKGWDFQPEVLARTFDLLHHPDQLKTHMVETLAFFWDNYLKIEWKRTESILNESADAFQQMQFDDMNAFDIVETVTNRDLRGKEYFEDEIGKATHMIFLPSPHLGPYVSWLSDDKTGDDMIFFGARLPKNAPRRSDALNRSELLVRLNALADETRLRMLEMLAKDGEVCAQDFITVLDLSQSSASRHLRQLTASGYITERRRDVAKCYTLNPERIKDTMKALGQFIG